MQIADLRALFFVERGRFAARYPACGSATLTVIRSRCPPTMPDCTERNVAWCYPDTARVYILARALKLSRSNLTALLRHELAHIACPPCSEARTDALASRVGGRKIRYDAREIQTLAARARHPRRPAHLPR
jgi:hypothetical protein